MVPPGEQARFSYVLFREDSTRKSLFYEQECLANALHYFPLLAVPVHLIYDEPRENSDPERDSPFELRFETYCAVNGFEIRNFEISEYRKTENIVNALLVRNDADFDLYFANHDVKTRYELFNTCQQKEIRTVFTNEEFSDAVENKEEYVIYANKVTPISMLLHLCISAEQERAVIEIANEGRLPCECPVLMDSTQDEILQRMELFCVRDYTFEAISYDEAAEKWLHEPEQARALFERDAWNNAYKTVMNYFADDNIVLRSRVEQLLFCSGTITLNCGLTEFRKHTLYVAGEQPRESIISIVRW